MTLSHARALADNARLLRVETVGRICEAVDRLAASTIATGPRDAARLVVLKAALMGPR